MDLCELLCTLQDAVADGEIQQVLSILKKIPPSITSLLITSSLDDENTTLLHISASHPSADILTTLLAQGAEVDCQNFDGLTALHVAATWGSVEVVRTLLEHGANPLIRDGDGLLPVDHARSSGHVECIHLLEGHSIDDDYTLSDDDHTHTNLEKGKELPQHDEDISMVEAFVSMYSDSNSDAECEDDITSVTPLSLDLSEYNYTPPANPPDQLNQTHTYPSPSHYSLTRQRLLYNSPPSSSKCTSKTAEHNGSFHQPCPYDDSVLYTTAVEDTFVMDKLTSVVDKAREEDNAMNGRNHKSMIHEADSPLNGAYTMGSSSRCKKDDEQEKRVDLLCDDFSNLTTSTSSGQSRPTGLHYQIPTHQSRQTSFAVRSTPSSSTYQSRQTGSSTCAASTCQSGQTSSTPSPLDCSFAADIQVHIPENLKSLTESELRERLLALGERPGPIMPSTKVAYLAYLAKLEAGVQPAGNKGYKGYKYELSLVLNGTVPLPDLTQLEQQVFKMFRTPSHSHTFTPSPVMANRSQNSTSSTCSNKKTTPISKRATPLSPFKTPPSYGSPRAAKDRGTKDHFNYLLFDPRILKRLFLTNDTSTTSHVTCGDSPLSELEEFRVFVESIFYVGKGKNSRSMQHLKDAKDYLTLRKTKIDAQCNIVGFVVDDCLASGILQQTRDFIRSLNPTPTLHVQLSTKLSRILDIWSDGYGIVSLQLFHNTTASEAFTREACIIEAIGLDLLTNIQRGHVYGDVSGWSMSRRRQLGVHLLHKAFQSYKLHPPQQIYQHDL